MKWRLEKGDVLDWIPYLVKPNQLRAYGMTVQDNPFAEAIIFISKKGLWFYASIVFQRDYTWIRQKNLHRQRSTDIPTCYLFVGALVGSTECSLPQELAYCGGGYIKEHWRSCDVGRIPWPHLNTQLHKFSVPNIWYWCHDKSNDWQCQSCVYTIKECIWNKIDSRCVKTQHI